MEQEIIDRELLEFAAKAAGHQVIAYANERGLWLHGMDDEWSPLTDDGDALRLAVKLDMQITINRVDQWTEVIGGYAGEHRMRLLHDSDMYAATRCAIVTVAYKIGVNMP